MEKDKKKTNFKEEKGITLVVLVITVIVLLILVSVTVNVGINSTSATRLQGFYTQLEIIQKRVDEVASINESYVDNENNTVYIKDQGTELTTSQTSWLEKISGEEGLNLTVENFKYFTVEDLQNTLDLINMEYNVFIDFDNRIIIAEDGIEIEGKMYYTLPETTYFIEHNANKNKGEYTLTYINIVSYTAETYKVTVVPSNTIGDLDNKNCYIKYKETTAQYWETSNNNDIIIKPSVQYNIQYEDSNHNMVEATIQLELSGDDGTPTVTEIK